MMIKREEGRKEFNLHVSLIAPTNFVIIMLIPCIRFAFYLHSTTFTPSLYTHKRLTRYSIMNNLRSMQLKIFKVLKWNT